VPVDVAALATDLQVETRALEQLLNALDAADWERPTPAPGWAVRDQISHLAFFDEAAARAALEPNAFRAEIAAAADDDFTEGIARRYRTLAVDELYAWFRAARAAMLEALLALDPSTRVPWYGPDMSVASSLTARIMETWAHGQDVYDAFDAPHPVTSAVRQVAHISARTLPNSFRARGLAVPDARVYVGLAAPDGEQWVWGDPAAADRVEGDAVEFCLVATQRRHVRATSLAVTGPVATQWMEIAQAFAGPPGAGRG
jgi:uncharacterized protein (TIGR03084 family)